MVRKLTIDSSVIISSLLENEAMHKEASAIMTEVLYGKAVAIMPYTRTYLKIVRAENILSCPRRRASRRP